MSKTKEFASAPQHAAPVQTLDHKTEAPEKRSNPSNATDLMAPSAGAPHRARMMHNMQHTTGNYRVSRMLNETIQPKLTISTPGDAHECEADEMASRVMRMTVEPSDPKIQRVCSCGGDENHPCPECAKKKETIHRQAEHGESPSITPEMESRIHSLRGGGQPLPPSVRREFEPRFGEDFGAVRVHTSAEAAHVSREINARAFTIGRDVMFGAGQYAPETGEGQKLLAHELTHVVQQAGGVRRQLADKPPIATTAGHLAHAQKELSAVASSLEQREDETRQPFPRLLLPKLKPPYPENAVRVAKELDDLSTVFETAEKELKASDQTASQLTKQLRQARTEARKTEGRPRPVLAEADKTAADLQQKLRIAQTAVNVNDLLELVAPVTNLCHSRDIDSDSIDTAIQQFTNFHTLVAGKQVGNLPGAARRVSFVLRYFAALNTKDFKSAPGQDEMGSMYGHIDLLRSDMELLFGKGASSLDFFKEVAEQINRQLGQLGAITMELGHETALVPGQADVSAYFKKLKAKSNDDVRKAYTEYAQAFFKHREATTPDDLNIAGLENIFERSTSLAGLRPLVCSGYALLGASLLGMTGAKPEKFIVAVRASQDQLQSGKFDAAHAVAVVKRQGATLFISNYLVFDTEDGAMDVAWKHPEFEQIEAQGKTVWDANAALKAKLAKMQQQGQRHK
jgi:hypothetical protein